MEKYRTVVTFEINDETENILHEIMGKEVEFTFLADIPSKKRKEALSDADILFSWNLPRELKEDEYALLNKVKFIQLLSAGADHIPFDKLPSHITIASNAGAYAEPMAEHALAMAIALSKRLLIQQRKLMEGDFDQFTFNRMIKGSVCGIIGFGGIGKATARLLKCLGAKIYAINTSGKTEEPVDFVGTLNDFEYVLESCDIAVISIALNKATKGLIGERELNWMKPDAVLINVARGAIMDEKALYEHLKSHPDFMAGIDAWWIEPFLHGEFRMNYPFHELPNIIASPHNSAMVPGIMANGIRLAAENVVSYIKSKSLRGLVRREDYD